ncbi:MAG: hypothetical protein ACYC6Y_29855 [Thermoguttaceae bacterium]
MDRRPKKAAVSHPPLPAKGLPPRNNYLLQFVLLVSAVALVIGAVVAWKFYASSDIWKAWALKVSAGKGSGNDVREALAKKSIRYLGGGYADLGVYSVGRYDAITNTTLIVEFRLKGMTPCEDEATFTQFMQANGRSFRERVNDAVRDCRGADCNDGKSLSRKVVARVNRAFSGRFLESAELADLSVFESVGGYQTQRWQSDDEAASTKGP